MRGIVFALAVCVCPVMAQEGLQPPQPDIDINDRDKYQCEKTLEYQPIASYRVSGLCEITDLKTVGDYQYGVEQIKNEIRAFRSEETVKRFIRGESRYRKEVRIELHKALKRTAVLICETDMMESKVFRAKIKRPRETEDGELGKDEERLSIEDGRLPDLGVFTYSRKVTYTVNRCK